MKLLLGILPLSFAVSYEQDLKDRHGCYHKCSQSGGSCDYCGEGGFCCAGKNHGYGYGPRENGNCPQDAINAVYAWGHACVVPVADGLRPTQPPMGEALVWRGDSTVATFEVNGAGTARESYDASYGREPRPDLNYDDILFDDNWKTFWLSDSETDPERGVTVTFNREIAFHKIMIQKKNYHYKKIPYKDVCLVLDGNPKICTPYDKGFDENAGDFIEWLTFEFPARNIKTIQLKFTGAGQAIIADMKVYYNPEFVHLPGLQIAKEVIQDCAGTDWAIDMLEGFIYHKKSTKPGDESDTWLMVDGQSDGEAGQKLDTITCSDELGLWGLNKDGQLFHRKNTRDRYTYGGASFNSKWQQFDEDNDKRYSSVQAQGNRLVTVSKFTQKTTIYGNFIWKTRSDSDGKKGTFVGFTKMLPEGHAFKAVIRDCSNAAYAVENKGDVYYQLPLEIVSTSIDRTWIKIGENMNQISCDDDMGLWAVAKDGKLYYRQMTRVTAGVAAIDGGTQWNNVVTFGEAFKSAYVAYDRLTLFSPYGEITQFAALEWSSTGLFAEFGYRQIYKGDVKIWHGESDIATFSTYPEGYTSPSSSTPDQVMFDGNKHTYWHSTGSSENSGITIRFKEQIAFRKLVLLKRAGHLDRYWGVCLYLDGDLKMCTGSRYGFEANAIEDNHKIVFDWPARHVSTVQLKWTFTHTSRPVSIADLGIFYHPEETTKIWHGESDVATFETSKSGCGGNVGVNGPSQTEPGKCENWRTAMFDESKYTYWHSGQNDDMEKGVPVTFKEQIAFKKIVIMKRHYWTQRYGNVCLALDGEDKLCTPETYGFEENKDDNGFGEPEFITWKVPQRNVKTVSLIFRNTEAAQISDMKIFYNVETDEVIKEPRELAAKFAEIMDGVTGELWNNVGRLKQGQAQKYNVRINKSVQKMMGKYYRYKRGCEAVPEEANEVPEAVRYDRDDPCKGVGQIVKALEKWGAKHNRNCENPDKEWKFHDRQKIILKNFRNLVRRQLHCEAR